MADGPAGWCDDRASAAGGDGFRTGPYDPDRGRDRTRRLAAYLGATGGVPRPTGLPDEQHPRTGAYKELRDLGMDLHELHALMAPRPFLISGGSEDPPERWIALNHAIEVNRLLGYEDRVAMTNRPKHDPTELSNAQIYRFFEHFLKQTPAPRG